MSATVVPLNESKKQIQLTGRVLAEQKQAFSRNPLPSLTERRDNLTRLKKTLMAHQEQLCEAIDKDFNGRSRDETLIAEIIPSVQGINYALGNLKDWMQPERRHVSVLFQPASNRVFYQPKGVVGIIVPWNYPLYLAIGPLVAALAAGNRAMIKMSEFTPHTSALLANLIESTFPRDLVAVINGEAAGMHPSRRKIAGRGEAALYDRLLEVQADLMRGPEGIDKPMTCSASLLAKVARQRPGAPGDMARLLGEKRAERFAEAFLDVIAEAG